MKEYPILQSGFVALDIAGLVRTDISRIKEMTAVTLKPYLVPDNPQFYDKEVDKLFRTYTSDNSVIKDFEFRESVIKKTVNLLDGKSLGEWMHFQNEQPTIGTIHRSFMVDTLEYLRSGYRKMDLYQWYGLVDASEGSVNLRFDVNDYFRRFGCSDNANRLPPNIKGIIPVWTSHENGFLDLLLTLNIIYGRRVTVKLGI